MDESTEVLVEGLDTAYHEAGHIVVAAIAGGRVTTATINAEEDILGCCKCDPFDKSGRVMNLYGSVLMHLAGVAATLIVKGKRDSHLIIENISKSKYDHEYLIEALSDHKAIAPYNANDYLMKAAKDLVLLFSDPYICNRVCSLAQKLILLKMLDTCDIEIEVDGLYEYVVERYVLECYKF